jgi:phosphatidate cytidylyltransferase
LASSNLATRLVTAFIGAPLILLLLYLGPPWGWFVFVAVAAVVGAVEFFTMTHAGDRPAQAAGTALTLGVMFVLWTWGTDPKALLAVLMLLPLLSLLIVLWRLGDMHTAALRVAAMAFGPLYLGAGLGAAVLIRRDAGADGPSYVVLALMFSWLSDTGGYFAGRFLGKHKLYEAVSPKKTVEGAIGGLFGAVLGALIAHYFFLRSLPLAHGVVLALVAAALGQAGDLGESLIKRSFGVKDSGGIVPGHGGILDRIDALLVTAPVTYLYILWLR